MSDALTSMSRSLDDLAQALDKLIDERDFLKASHNRLLESLKDLAAICERAAPDHNVALSRALCAIAKAEGHTS